MGFFLFFVFFERKGSFLKVAGFLGHSPPMLLFARHSVLMLSSKVAGISSGVVCKVFHPCTSEQCSTNSYVSHLTVAVLILHVAKPPKLSEIQVHSN